MLPEIDFETAEIRMLTAMLLDPTTIPTVLTIVNAGDLHNDARRKFFDLLVDMDQAGESICDVTLVFTRVKACGLLDELGGHDGFRAFTDPNASPNADHYARAVRSHAVRRHLQNAANQFAARVHDSDPLALTTWLRSELDAIQAKATDTAHVSTLSETCTDLIDEIDRTEREGSSPYIATGLDSYDSVYGGFAPSRLIVAAGRPGGGKTSWAQQFGEFIARQPDQAVHFVSLEMPRCEIAARYMARQTGINNKFISAHTVGPDDRKKLMEAEQASQAVSMTVSEPTGQRATLAAICAEIRVQKATRNISLAVIDYLQIMNPSFKGQTDYDRISEASRGLKQLAMELEIPILALSQLNRSSEEGKAPRQPRLSDLRGSGSIEQDADVVILLSAEGKGRVLMDVAKCRGGEPNPFHLKFDGATTTFSDLPIEDHANYNPEFGDGAW